MENASKALIIAGAILLSIIIISLGIAVVTNSRSTIDKANVNQQEVETFNSRFEAYVGNDKSPSEVRALVSAVISSNGAQTTNATYHYVTCVSGAALPNAHTPNATTPPTVTMPNNLIAGKTYTVSLGYDTAGYVNRISYNENTQNATN